MFSIQVALMGLGLATDAALVSFALGLICLEMKWHDKYLRGIISSTVFGVLQFLMLWIGSYGGFLFSFSPYGHMTHFLVGSIFLLMAVKFIQDSHKKKAPELDWGILPLMILGFATSVDALFAGISLGTLPQSYLAAIGVGLITFSLCLISFFISQFFKKIPDQWLLRLAAIIFAILGGKIVLSQMTRGWL